VTPDDRQVPPAGEEIHLPGPSVLPLLVAALTSVALVGVTLFWPLSVVASLLLVWCIVRWVRDTRRDIDELPLEHH
jgi:membrane protein implicated in regulation of membrane protease activity